MKTVILLSTYNGSKYIKEQIESLFAQTYKNFEIIARDDGSSDNTLNILNSYNITVLNSKKNIGVENSFMFLLDYAFKRTDAKYFMFCDQDDIWKKNKIEKTLNTMKKMETTYSNMPILIHTDLEVVDENLTLKYHSFWQYEHINPKFYSLNRLLMQNTITGCTMMVNRKLVEFILPIQKNIILHDWWIGLVASQFGKINYNIHGYA